MSGVCLVPFIVTLNDGREAPGQAVSALLCERSCRSCVGCRECRCECREFTAHSIEKNALDLFREVVRATGQ